MHKCLLRVRCQNSMNVSDKGQSRLALFPEDATLQTTATAIKTIRLISQPISNRISCLQYRFYSQKISAYHIIFMNSVGVLRRPAQEAEDFFTSLSFSTLLGELPCKQDLFGHFDSHMAMPGSKVRIRADFERVWNAREDENFLRKIFN